MFCITFIYRLSFKNDQISGVKEVIISPCSQTRFVYCLRVTFVCSRNNTLGRLFFSLNVRQIDLKADVSTALITELSPKTDYTLSVHAMYPSRVGDSATITVQTSGCHTSLHAPFKSTQNCSGAPVVDFIALHFPEPVFVF